MASTSASVDIDALPYYDTDIDTVAGLRERLDTIVNEELQASGSASELQSDDTRIPPELPDLFSSSPFLLAELDRISQKRPVKGLDSVRYSLPAPPLNAPGAAWTKALDNAASQLEHQSARLNNLDLMAKYGSNSWRVANYLVEREIERIETRVANVKSATEEVNRERKAKQLEAGSQLQSLEARWQSLVSGNLQLEIANLQLEMEVDALREREEEVKARLAEMQQV